MPNGFKHILVIRLSAMGDVAMTVPVIRAFSEQHPEVKITILTRSFFKPFFEGINNVSVYEADVRDRHKGVLGLRKLSKELKALQIDAVADLHNVLRTKILKFYFKNTAFFQIDKGRKEKKDLITGKHFKQLKTTHQRYADVFEKLGLEVDLSNPIFPSKTALNSKCKDLLGDYDSLIGIAPFAAFEGKSYPLSLMIEAIEILEKTHKIVLFGGGQQEIDQLNSIETKCSNVINLAGKLTLTEEIEIISNLNIMISMDSGNAHVAAMLGVKVLTLWGVTHPFAGFYPFHQNPDNALLADRGIYERIPTSVYGNKYPIGYKNAIDTIRPHDIISKVNDLL